MDSFDLYKDYEQHAILQRSGLRRSFSVRFRGLAFRVWDFWPGGSKLSGLL